MCSRVWVCGIFSKAKLADQVRENLCAPLRMALHDVAFRRLQRPRLEHDRVGTRDLADVVQRCEQAHRLRPLLLQPELRRQRNGNQLRIVRHADQMLARLVVARPAHPAQQRARPQDRDRAQRTLDDERDDPDELGRARVTASDKIRSRRELKNTKPRKPARCSSSVSRPPRSRANALLAEQRRLSSITRELHVRRSSSSQVALPSATPSARECRGRAGWPEGS